MEFLPFKELVEKKRIKKEATSNIKIKGISNTLRASGELIIQDSCGVYERDDKFTTTAGIVNLHPTKGTHWVMFINQIYFDSFGFAPPVNIK